MRSTMGCALHGICWAAQKLLHSCCMHCSARVRRMRSTMGRALHGTCWAAQKLLHSCCMHCLAWHRRMRSTMGRALHGILSSTEATAQLLYALLGMAQEDEEHHGPDLERMGHDEIAAVAAASLRARGSVPSEGLDQSPSRTDECWIEDSRSPKGVPKHPAARRGDGVEGAEVREHHRLSQGGTGGGWVPRSEMTPYGLQGGIKKQIN
eukprot:1150927-Pelagomonas_calceolata.AAC.1